MKKLLYPLLLLLSVHAFGQELYYTYHGKKIPLKADSSVVYVEFENPESAKSFNERFASAKMAGSRQVTLLGRQGVKFHNAMNDFWNKAVSKEKNILFTAPILRTEKSFIIVRPVILLKLKDGEDGLKAMLKKYALADSKYESLGSPGVYKVAYQNGSYRSLLNLCNRIAADKNIAWCEPDFFSDIKLETRRGPLYPDQYHLNNTGQSGGTAGIDIRAEGAWLSTTGASTLRVAIVDNGISAHEDYAGRLLTGWTAGEPTGFGEPTFPTNSHGIACAGIIGATHNNGLGVRGVAPGVQLISINIFPDDGASNAEIASAINWAWNPNGAAADVLSNSWTQGEAQVITDAFNSAMTLGRGNLGSIVVACSGNKGNQDVNFPANIPGVISVGACNHNGVICGYSQRGSAMDVVAPSGENGAGGIVTTDAMGTNGKNPGNYMTDFDGTSAAAPQVAGIAALILSINPNLTNSQVTKAIQRSATDMGPAGFDNTYGYGRANACGALEQAIIETGISGPSAFCGPSGNYSIGNFPGFTFQGWSIWPTNGATLTPSGNTATLTKDFDNGVTLTATFASPCGGTIAVNKGVSMGLPVLNAVFIDNLNYPGSICSTDGLNNGYPVMQPGSQADHFDVTVTPPSGPVRNFTATGTEFIIPVRVNGTHTLSVTPVNSCGSGTPVVFEFEAVDCLLMSARSARKTSGKEGITVSPNPAYKTAVITFNGQQKVSKTGSAQSTEIRVLDMNGAVKLTRRVPQGTNNIPLEIGSLPAGMYIVEARSSGVSHTAKLLIAR